MRILIVSKHSFGSTDLTGVKSVELVHGTAGDNYKITFENTSRANLTYSVEEYFVQILIG